MKMFSKQSEGKAKNAKVLEERLTPEQVRASILKGIPFDPHHFHGSLDLSGEGSLNRGLENLQLNSLNLRDCTGLEQLPASLVVRFDLVLDGCENLTHLPEGLQVGSLSLRRCTGITALPERLETYFLDISDCVNFRDWPVQGVLQYGNLVARNCINLTHLPDWLGPLSILDLRDSPNVHVLPESLVVNSWLDIAGTRITDLPPGCRDAQLRWRGIPVEKRLVFQPETITAEEVLSETNLEKRRVKLERMGYERFIEEARAEVLDRDQDPGGERRLLRIELPGDEPLVCVSVQCPSTGRLYVIRVPPDMTTCHQAAAWIAGFDDPNTYHPVQET